MHLVSTRQQLVRVAAADLEIEFQKDEWIWTESSYKYEPEQVLSEGGKPVSGRRAVDRRGLALRADAVQGVVTYPAPDRRFDRRSIAHVRRAGASRSAGTQRSLVNAEGRPRSSGNRCPSLAIQDRRATCELPTVRLDCQLHPRERRCRPATRFASPESSRSASVAEVRAAAPARHS